MNNFYSYIMLNDLHNEIESLLKEQSKKFNDKYFDFLMLLVQLFNNLIDFDMFMKLYKNLYNELDDQEKELFEKIVKLEISNIIKFKDENNLWAKDKNLTLKKKGNDKNE